MEVSVSKILAAIVVLLAALDARLAAQVTTATFYGIVTDASGATVPGASATLTEQNTGSVTSKNTDGAGEFAFDFVHVGTYTLRIEAKGFKTLLFGGVSFNAGQLI